MAMEKVSSDIASLFFVRIFPISLMTRSAGVLVVWTVKYFLASFARDGYSILFQFPFHQVKGLSDILSVLSFE